MKYKNTQKPQKATENNFHTLSYSNNHSLVKKKILGVGITNDTKENILEFVVNSLQKSKENYYITTPNPEMIVYASTHPDVKTILENAKIALCDGIGLVWGSWLLGSSLKSRFTGVEMVEKLCEKVKDRPITVGFFGGGPKIAELTAECLQQKYPGLKVALTTDTWSDSQDDGKGKMESGNEHSLTKENNHTKLYTLSPMPKRIDILFVALGFPKQEVWMANHIKTSHIKVMIGVGGAFDYISGKVMHAPGFVRAIGLEWLFRLIVEPWRIRRQLALPVFVWMILKEKFFLSHSLIS